MSRLLAALVVAGILAIHAGARAEGWTTTGLGTFDSRDECMNKSERAAQRYKSEYRLHSIMRRKWSIHVYDANATEDDFIFLCPIIGGKVGAFLVIHGDSTDSRFAIQDRLKHFWNND